MDKNAYKEEIKRLVSRWNVLTHNEEVRNKEGKK